MVYGHAFRPRRGRAWPPRRRVSLDDMRAMVRAGRRVRLRRPCALRLEFLRIESCRHRGSRAFPSRSDAVRRCQRELLPLMTATVAHRSWPAPGTAPPASGWRFGRDVPAAGRAGALQWLLKRNCSITPRQLCGVYLSLCAGVAASPRASGRRARRWCWPSPPSSCSASASRCWSTLAMPPTARCSRCVGPRWRSSTAAAAASSAPTSRRLAGGRACRTAGLAGRTLGPGPAHARRPLHAPRTARRFRQELRRALRQRRQPPNTERDTN